MSRNRNLDYFIGIPLTYFFSLFSSRRTHTFLPPDKILIIKLAAAGDTILLVPVLRALRTAYPDAQIHWLVSTANAALARGVPSVDKVIVWSRGIGSLLPLVAQLRSQKYNLIFDLEQWSRGTGLLSFFSGAPIRVGYDTPGQYREKLYTHTIPKRFDRHEIHDFVSLLSIPKPLQCNLTFELPVSDAGTNELNEKASFLFDKNKTRLMILIHPGCGSDGLPREWPLENYAVLAHWLQKKYQAEIILSGGPEESFKTMALRKLLSGRAVDLGGKLSWPGLIALVQKVDMVISGNTGVMHVAAALQKKQIALHGPTDPKIWGPLNPHAKIIQTDCPKCPCLKLGFEYHTRDQSCMRRIQVDAVKSTVSSLIDNNKGI